MADEISLGEVARGIKRIEERLQDLSTKVVSAEVYGRDQRELERRFAELERDLEAERTAREKDIAAVYKRLEQGGANWRQTLYNGLLPAVFFVITIVVTLWVATRSGK